MVERPNIVLTLFEFTSNDPDHVPSRYREDVTLLYVESEEEARGLAEENFRGDAGIHENEAGYDITVTPKVMIGVTAASTEDPSEGGDLYSRHLHDIDFHDIEAYPRWSRCWGPNGGGVSRPVTTERPLWVRAEPYGRISGSTLVPSVGLEPTRPFGQRFLRPSRLPVPPTRRTGWK